MPENLVPFPDGSKDLRARGDATMARNSMKIGPRMACIAVECRITAHVTNSDSSPVASLSMDARKAFLSAYTVSLSRYLGKTVAAIEPYQEHSSAVVRDDLRIQQEVDYVGLTGTTPGTLGGSFAPGANVVKFTLVVPLGALAFVKDGEKFQGVCAEQLLDMALKLKCGADPFAAANAKLKLESQAVEFVPRTRKARNRRHGCLIVNRKITNPQNDNVRTPDGLTVGFWDEGALADTTLETLRVQVLTAGHDVVTVTDDPNTPFEIFAKYDLEPGSDATEDSGHTEDRTPLFIVEEKVFKNLYTGAVLVKQVKRKDDFSAIANYIETPSTAQVKAEITLMAEKLPRTRQLLAVSTAAVEKLECDDEQRPFTGWTGFTDEDPEFYEFCGYLCLPGGEPRVFIPPERKRKAALQMLDAMQPSPEYPEGNTGAVEAIRRAIAREFPGGLVDVVEGFSVPSGTYSEIQKQLAAEVNVITAQMAARRAAAK
ncbi:hypothetical protein [Corallococcus sp. EGB]|uniref:hypothetical protein n=1 Tax=Corallococcus sp. EGB TaxID=1521117 RepID=UPI001CBB6792|nr:hypothetical protein [Corallococcus sp. EGB]